MPVRWYNQEHLNEKDVRATCRDLVSPPSHPPEQSISLRSPMVGYISRGMEWHHNDAWWELKPSITSGACGRMHQGILVVE